jgi:hypothetical protein
MIIVHQSTTIHHVFLHFCNGKTSIFSTHANLPRNLGCRGASSGSETALGTHDVIPAGLLVLIVGPRKIRDVYGLIPWLKKTSLTSY